MSKNKNLSGLGIDHYETMKKNASTFADCDWSDAVYEIWASKL